VELSGSLVFKDPEERILSLGGIAQVKEHIPFKLRGKKIPQVMSLKMLKKSKIRIFRKQGAPKTEPGEIEKSPGIRIFQSVAPLYIFEKNRSLPSLKEAGGEIFVVRGILQRFF
jgi:hypothetical protein